MSIKKGVLIVIIVLVIAGNIFLYLNRDSQLLNSITFSGNSISSIEEIKKINLSVAFFVLQWILIAIISVIAYVKYMQHKHREEKKATITKPKELKSISQTEFDLLYQLLEEKESLNLKTICKIFTISKDKALDWAKILEENNLITIEYPTFGDPELMIKKEETEEEKKKEDKGNEKKSNIKEGKSQKKESNEVEKKDKKISKKVIKKKKKK